MSEDPAIDGGTAREHAEFPAAPVPWTVLHGVGMVALYVLLQVAFGLLAFLVAGAASAEPVGLSLQMGGAFVVVLLAIWLFLRTAAGGSAEAAGAIGLRIASPLRAARRALTPLLIGIPILLLCAAAQAEVFHYFRVNPPEQEVIIAIRELAARADPLQVGVLVFGTVVAAPLAEELMFRGLLYLPLRARLGRLPAALVVSVAFAAMHPLWGLGQIFVLAMILTWAMEATRTMAAPIVFHAAYNALTIALVLRQV